MVKNSSIQFATNSNSGRKLDQVIVEQDNSTSNHSTRHDILTKTKNPDKKSHTCSICSRKFPDIWKLNSHSWVHLTPDEKRVVKAEWTDRCYFCAKTFRTFSTLREHIAIHTEEKAFSCPTCKLQFFQKQHLTNHLWVHLSSEEKEENKAFNCPTCRECFSTKSNLTTHLFHHLTPEEKERTMEGWKYDCKLCGKRFRAETHLNRHIISTHTREKHYPCSQCDKAFNRQGSLTRHLRTHSRDPATRRPFLCGHCDKAFTQRNVLIRHQTTVHFGLREFQCPQCKKKFSRESHLTTHVNAIHAKIRHPCAHCHKTFSQKGKARMHEKQVHH